ncbi:hypothetical protein HOY80DRAFT_879239 [Tuber brumale]|nr:hypothetical protein HOY80DRAFT_879239 [Tuber brumale]
MRVYKCRFGPLWITTLVLSYSFLEVGGQTLGCLARGRCFRGCFSKCPGLETNCVCSGFRTALDMMDILNCALASCPVAEAVDSFSSLEVGCRPIISTTTGRSRTSSSTTPTTLTARVVVGPATSTLTPARPTSTPILPSCSTSSSSRSLNSGSSYLIPSSSPSSRCTTMNSSPASPIPTSPAITSQTLPPTPLPSRSFYPNDPHPPPLGQRDQRPQINRGLVAALVLGPLGFLTSLLAIFLILRRCRGRNRRSITSFAGICDLDANQGSITAPLPTLSSDPPRVPLADFGIRPTTRGSQMSAGVEAGTMAAVAATRGAPARSEDIVSATPVSGSSRGNNQLYIFPPTSRRLPAAQRQPQSQQNPDLLLRSLRKPLPQLPRQLEDARIGPRAGPSTRNTPLASLPTVYPIVDNPRPMSAISELEEVDRCQPISDDSTEVEFRRVYHDVRRALNRSPSTSTDQNSTDWSIMTDLSGDSTNRSFRPERRSL